MASEHRIIWSGQPEARKSWPEPREEAFRGASIDAMRDIMEMVEGPDDIACHVFREILATVQKCTDR
jgi:hypothetical protein